MAAYVSVVASEKKRRSRAVLRDASAGAGGSTLTRRGVTSAAVVGGVTATLLARPAAANAVATAYTPVAYTKTRLAGSMERHIANRFGYGWTPALGKEIALAGGWRLWFERQLTGLLVDDSFYKTSSTWWPSINASAATIWDWHVSDTHKLWATMHDYKRWLLSAGFTPAGRCWSR